jgi:hypothetical protein
MGDQMTTQRCLTIAVLSAALTASCGYAEEPVETIEQPLTRGFISPYSAPAGVLVVVGQVSGNPWLVFWRSTDAHCTWFQLGTNGWMTSSIDIEMGSAAFSEMHALALGQTKAVFCSNFGQSWTLSSPEQGYMSISFRGTPGADFMNCSGRPGGPVACLGNDGNDIIEATQNFDLVLSGGAGNDKVRVTNVPGGPSVPRLSGNGGDDCLTVSSWSQAQLDGGDNTDVCSASGTSCEIVTSTACP